MIPPPSSALAGPEILKRFVAHARQNDLSYEFIRHMLRAQGWKDTEICSAIAAHALQMDIPNAKRQGGARETFYHLSAFTCLYVATVGFILMVFTLIDVTWPDATDLNGQTNWAYSTIRSSLATVIVFFPLFVGITWLIRRQTDQGNLISGSGIERWLTYLSLFVIVMTVLVNAATVLYSFLDGKMTTPLAIKTVLLFVLMGAAFIYMERTTAKWLTSPTPRVGAGKG